MGAGKTAVGTRLAGRLGWPLRDSDADIEALEHHTVRELRDARGTEALHELEARHLLEALGAPAPSVVCPAASVVDRDDCVRAMRDPRVAVVWLMVSPGVAAQRFHRGDHRPSYGEDPALFLAHQAEVRDPRFRAIATLSLDVDVNTPDKLADAIADQLHTRLATGR
jgi:shikimate kinase